MRLILLRHAKSSWDDLALADHDRPLAHRGIRAAEAMNEHLAAEGFEADRVISSTAVRALETAHRLLADLAPPAEEDSELYMASPHSILEVVRRHGDALDRMVVVGHNPGMHELAARLARGADTAEARRIESKFPTGGLAEFEVRSDRWDDVGPDTVQLVRFVRPKDLPDARKLRL